ncbi:riboflavin kinase/FMN adenylyltransferase [Tepidimonas ignava]|uniref:Riboflavin biosynthesis protein n=1 Tax=Tepidimonas ignava TaxID=114249 RepID=A0A4R3L753_9BURK|nr:bifunctional riboflavin kinase/FAD synthetase [Tepidimonas ignava]TCS95302.1 riboflavin kinase/FMN adenylyltransferase [Tepidimonas ignava]TSE19759.1 Riboflavin biosynthesis protein RibF [Tepidimonas ignava]
MNIVFGLHNLLRQPPRARALTIGNFDGVHRGHQAMLALLLNEARHRGLPACALTFEPHPRDFFAARARNPALAPARIATLRDKLEELRRCGIDECIILPFHERLAALSAEAFIDEVLVRALGVRYVLVGDDFRFGAGRRGDYALLDAAGDARGFEVARMRSYEVHGQRVSSSAVRAALAAGDMEAAAALLGRPYAISGHVVHGRKLGRALGESSAGRGDGFRTLNLRFSHWKPAASGIFVVQVHGLDPTPGAAPLPGVANLGVRPSLDARDVNGGRVLLETHCLTWPARVQAALASAPVPGEAYGRIIRVELLHKLHDELRYPSLDALAAGIAQDCADARAWWAARGLHSAHHEA